MKFIILIYLSLLLLGQSSYASMFGEETAVLIEIATTTASQLNELERLVSNTEKYTEKMQKYNELFQDQYFRAERVLYVSESLAAKKEAANLETLNWAIRDLKYSMVELKSLMAEYADIKNNADRSKVLVKAQKKINRKKSRVATHQIKSAISAKTTGRATQLTARNTALIYEQDIEAHNTQLEILEAIAVSNRLLAEKQEQDKFMEYQKRRSYGVKNK